MELVLHKLARCKLCQRCSQAGHFPFSVCVCVCVGSNVCCPPVMMILQSEINDLISSRLSPIVGEPRHHQASEVNKASY